METLLPQQIMERNSPGDDGKLPALDYRMLDWIAGNVSPKTQIPLSFAIAQDRKPDIYKRMGKPHSTEGVIERVIVEEGLVIYDGAVAQIALSMSRRGDYLKKALRPVEVYWKGRLEEISSIRAGYPVNNFIYDPHTPQEVSSDLADTGKRGFIFRIINANGHYRSVDPLDGKDTLEGFPNYDVIHWEDWKPVAGENAWVAMAALHIYHQKYFNPLTGAYEGPEHSIELELAKELARAAMILQADNGGIRMGPIGAHRDEKDFMDPAHKQGEWWYYQISSENNLSWHAALRMLHAVTGEEKYAAAAEGIESYFRGVWNDEFQYFYQGMSFYGGEWHPNDEHFALDVQTWGILALGPEKIDGWFGEGSALKMWGISKIFSGYWLADKELAGVGYTQEHDRLSVEWTAGAIMAARSLADHYRSRGRGEWAAAAAHDAGMMRKNIDILKTRVNDSHDAYSYSSRRGWIPFGWFSHDPEVLSVASTGWMIFVDAGFNPFLLPGKFKTAVPAQAGRLVLD